jgi:hypothetical protein
MRECKLGSARKGCEASDDEVEDAHRARGEGGLKIS